MKDQEFEKNREEFLKRAGMYPQHDKSSNIKTSKKTIYELDSQKYAWEYELAAHRRRQLKDRFYALGAMCGILSLVLTCIFNIDKIKIFITTIFK